MENKRLDDRNLHCRASCFGLRIMRPFGANASFYLFPQSNLCVKAAFKVEGQKRMTSVSSALPRNSRSNSSVMFRRRPNAPQPTPSVKSKGYFKHRSAKIENFRPGYPRLAAFLNSDRTLCAFKKFGRLHARVLLYKQDEILELQERLDNLDTNEKTAYFLHTRRDDRNTDRQQLLSNIGEKLVEYNTLLEGYYRHLEGRRPRESQLQSITNWLEGNKPLVPTDSAAYQDWEDLSTPLSPSDHGGLECFLERCAVGLRKRRVPWIFSTKRDREKSIDHHIIHFSATRIATVSRFLTAILAVTTLTVPIAVLYNIERMSSRLWAIAMFTATFSAALCVTQTRNFEIFSATAAYCAVMVVFVANLPT